jgi:hypothetical protein
MVHPEGVKSLSKRAPCELQSHIWRPMQAALKSAASFRKPQTDAPPLDKHESQILIWRTIRGSNYVCCLDSRQSRNAP